MPRVVSNTRIIYLRVDFAHLLFLVLCLVPRTHSILKGGTAVEKLIRLKQITTQLGKKPKIGTVLGFMVLLDRDT